MSSPQIPVVLITGAAKRIGAAIAKKMHANGYKVLLHCRKSRAQSDALCTAFNDERPDSAKVLVADLSQISKIKTLADAAQQCWGRIDVLVNNASAFHPTQLATLTEEHWDDLININLRAPLFLSQRLAHSLRASKGCIINMVDIHAERPLKEHTVYCASKAGLAMLTRSLARELAPDVRCNGIAPGAIVWPEDSDRKAQEDIIARTALKRAGCPDDIAQTVLFLSQYADYITGQIIAVDGGRTLSN